MPNVFIDMQRYKVLLFVGFCLLVAADMVIIFNNIAGLFLFFIYHIMNILNYSLLSNSRETSYILQQWFILFVLILLLFIILKLPFKINEFEKFLKDNNVPAFLQHSIYAQMLVFIYILSALISGWCGYKLFYVKGFNMLFSSLASIGALIFAAGDYFIFYEILKRPGRPFHQILNNILYYIPLILYAMLSVIKNI